MRPCAGVGSAAPAELEATGKATAECQPAPWHATGPANALASVSAVQQRPHEVRTCLQLAPGVLWFCQQNWKGIAELILPVQIGFEMEIVRLPGGRTGVLRRCRVAASGTGSSAHAPEGLCWARLCSRGCTRNDTGSQGQRWDSMGRLLTLEIWVLSCSCCRQCLGKKKMNCSGQHFHWSQTV